MELKVINESNREIPEELVESMKADEGFDQYQQILDKYNLKFGEIDIFYKEDKLTVVIKDK